MTNKSKKYDIEGNELESVVIQSLDSENKAHYQSIKDYIKAIRRNLRQWSANTKDRSQSNHSGAKPHAQKGTGKARQGFLGAPQYKGGGRVHTPKPKFDQHVRINKKERRSVISTLLNEKIESENLVFLQDSLSENLAAPKTAVMANFLKKTGFEGKSCLFVVEKREEKAFDSLQKSLKNIPKVSFQYVDNLNGYSIIAHQKVVVLETCESNVKELVRG